MPRAPKRCGPKCPNKVFRYGRCKEHQPERIPWQKSEDSPDRSYLKTPAWDRQRRRILWRDNNERGGCQGRYVDDCTGVATSVDHISPVWYTGVDEVDDEDLQGLCEPCHKYKTSLDGYFAKMIKNGKVNIERKNSKPCVDTPDEVWQSTGTTKNVPIRGMWVEA